MTKDDAYKLSFFMSSSKLPRDGSLVRPAENAALSGQKEVSSVALPFKSPICVQGESLHASRDAAKESPKTFVQQNRTPNGKSCTPAN